MVAVDRKESRSGKSREKTSKKERGAGREEEGSSAIEVR